MKRRNPLFWPNMAIFGLAGALVGAILVFVTECNSARAHDPFSYEGALQELMQGEPLAAPYPGGPIIIYTDTVTINRQAAPPSGSYANYEAMAAQWRAMTRRQVDVIRRASGPPRDNVPAHSYWVCPHGRAVVWRDCYLVRER